jgi:hypothetical protein
VVYSISFMKRSAVEVGLYTGCRAFREWVQTLLLTIADPNITGDSSHQPIPINSIIALSLHV